MVAAIVPARFPYAVRTMLRGQSGNVRLACIIAIVAVLYVVSGKLGLRLAFVQANATAVWPPTGLALAALILFGLRAWPAVFLGALVVNVTTPGTSAPLATSIAVGNTSEAVLGAYLVRVASRDHPPLETANDVFRFAGIASMCTAVSAALGVLSLSLAGRLPLTDLQPAFVTWWLGDFSGALLIAPPLILWALPTREVPAYSGRAAIMLVLATAGLGSIVFGGLIGLSRAHSPFGFVLMPVLVWAALSFGRRETTLCVLTLSGVAIAGTLGGYGPYGGRDAGQALLLVQGFMAVMALTSLALAAAVSERRRAEAELRAAKTEAEVAVTVRDDFLNLASHELRTPLTVFMGLGQLIARRLHAVDVDAIKTLQGPADELNVYADRMDRLVNELLDTSRIQQGRLRLDRQDVDLVALVNTVGSRLRDHPRTTPAHVLSIYSAEAVRGLWDPARLEQVLTILLLNAVKYSPRGGAISVAVKAAEAEAEVTVEDQGIGIAEDRLPRLFEPFTRLHDDAGIDGMGMGLYIAQQVVRRHGGSLHATSELGRGTAFTIRLPLAEVSESTVGSTPTP